MAEIKEITIDINGNEYKVKRAKTINAVHTGNMNANGWLYPDTKTIVIKEDLSIDQLQETLYYYISLATIYEIYQDEDLVDVFESAFGVAKFIASNALKITQNVTELTFTFIAAKSMTTPPIN